MYYYLYIDGEQKGPFMLGQLRAMWQQGTITAETFFWQEGMETWGPITDIANRFSEPPAANSEAPPARSPAPSPQVEGASTRTVTPAGTSSTRSGCLGCAAFIALPLICWGLYGIASALQGYTYPSVEIEMHKPSYDALRGKWNSYTAEDVEKTAQTDERVFSVIFGIVLIGGSVGLLLFANAVTKPKD